MRVGLIGTGRIGAFHARTLSSNARVTSLVVADVDATRAESVAAEVGAETARDALDLARRVDALVITTAAGSHAELVRLAADARLPVFCEKPLSLELDITNQVIEHVALAGISLQVGFQRRFDVGFAEARRLVASGQLGRLYAARLATHDPAPPTAAYERASGGLYRDLMIHDFDQIRWTTGQEVQEVFAVGAMLTGDDAFTQADDIDTAAVVLRLTDGGYAVVTGLRHNPRGYDVRLEIFGSRDSVVSGMDQRTPMLVIGDDGETTANPGYRDFMERFESAYRDELDAFLSVARGEIESPCTGVDAREALRIALAAMRSQRDRRPVALEEIR